MSEKHDLELKYSVICRRCKGRGKKLHKCALCKKMVCQDCCAEIGFCKVHYKKELKKKTR